MPYMFVSPPGMMRCPAHSADECSQGPLMLHLFGHGNGAGGGDDMYRTVSARVEHDEYGEPLDHATLLGTQMSHLSIGAATAPTDGPPAQPTARVPKKPKHGTNRKPPSDASSVRITVSHTLAVS